MPLNNLNNTHLPTANVTAGDTALNSFETAIQIITIQLTPEDRQQYGSINEQNKLFVNKVNDFNRSQPALSATDVDWAEFNRDFQSRAVLEGWINRLQGFMDRLNNAKTMHDYDNYQAGLNDYANTAYRAGRGAAGFENKQAELKQFFNRTRHTGGNTGSNPGTTPDVTPATPDNAAS